MEVMMATEAKDSGEALTSMQLKMRSMKEKLGEKMRAAKQVQNSLKLEIRSKDDELNNARRDTTMQIELNQRLTSELESTKARSGTLLEKVRSMEEKLASLQGVQMNSNANQADYASAAQQFADRMDERARSVQIETEAKTKDLLKAKFDKRELEQQAKYQEMVTTMQNQYQQLADTRKAETQAAEEKLKRFENEYILRGEHIREVETAEKGEMKEAIDSLKSGRKEMEEEKKASLEAMRKMEEEAIGKERSANEQKLKMKDLEINAENAINGADTLKNEVSGLKRKLEHAQNVQESAEKQKTEALMSKANEHTAAMNELQRKLDDMERKTASEVDKIKDGARNVELKLVQKDGEIDKLQEKCKGLEEIESVLTKQVGEKDSRISSLETDIADLKGEEAMQGKSLNAKQRSIRELQRLVDRKLVPMKVDLQQLKVQVGAELESFGKDTYEIVKSVHEKWGEKNKVVTRRLSMHFDKELFNLKQNYESEKQENVSTLVKAEIDKREAVVADKDEEIRSLEEEIKSLMEGLQKKTEEDHKENSALHTKMEEDKENLMVELQRVKVEKERADSIVEELRSKCEVLENNAGALDLAKSKLLAEEEEMRREIDGYKSKLDMIVVCLESEFKFGGVVEEGLLNPNEVDFRGALRELTGAWEKKCDALKQKEREPLEQIIESNKEEMRRIVGELGAVHETRIVAEERVKELEVDNGKLEIELNQLRGEASELKDRSIMVDDLERSRSEVAMLAELQRIEGDSKERGLKGELTEVKRKYEEKMRQLERKLAKENWDKEERFRGDIKMLKGEKNDLVLQNEKALNEERVKLREVEDAMHGKEVLNQREINKLEVEVMGLRNEVERLGRRGVERDLLVLKENIDVIERAGGDGTGTTGKKYGGGGDIQARLAQIENLALSLEEGAIGSVVMETISPGGEGKGGGGGDGAPIDTNVTERRKGKREADGAMEDDDDVGGGQEEELF
ncbi:hypothetical protein TrRE_jg11078 [Triparma retinervis]|uniref:Uncharacterized protein n=1 Tax=Triparma retinervis TaxID=2557542 RepID=A0A9W7L6C8_9STRA|nr:hypothetical protein TrRE_jg11078 [Triparma retinervis]